MIVERVTNTSKKKIEQSNKRFVNKYRKKKVIPALANSRKKLPNSQTPFSNNRLKRLNKSMDSRKYKNKNVASNLSKLSNSKISKVDQKGGYPNLSSFSKNEQETFLGREREDGRSK